MEGKGSVDPLEYLNRKARGSGHVQKPLGRLAACGRGLGTRPPVEESFVVWVWATALRTDDPAAFASPAYVCITRRRPARNQTPTNASIDSTIAGSIVGAAPRAGDSHIERPLLGCVQQRSSAPFRAPNSPFCYPLQTTLTIQRVCRVAGLAAYAPRLPTAHLADVPIDAISG